MDTADIINACEHKYRSVGWAGLTSQQRLVVLASRANFEVETGGVAAFFHHSTGAYARETVDALVELGAMDEAAAIHQGKELLRSQSWAQLAASGQFERLTDKFLASMPGLFARLATFVEMHREELEESGPEGALEDTRTTRR